MDDLKMLRGPTWIVLAMSNKQRWLDFVVYLVIAMVVWAWYRHWRDQDQ